MKCGDRNFVLGQRTLVMGILNVTPDSFSDGGNFDACSVALSHAHRLLKDGADIIDVGGESTRPGAQEISVEQELERVLPVVKAMIADGIRNISIDTRRAKVARLCLAEGASWINDVSGLTFDAGMLDAVLPADGVVIMHSRGLPQTMQQGKIIYSDVVREVRKFLGDQVDRLVAAGYNKKKIIVDPGIGFGKTLEHNRALSRHLAELNHLGAGILYGPSRKAFIGQITGVQRASERDFGTVGAVVYAALHGVSIVRVHNVKAAREALMMSDWLNQEQI